MQFHLDGFRPGDPELLPEVGEGTREPLPERVDVLVVGEGPAGLTLAAQLAKFPEITTRIVERRPGPLTKGQADGISCRTMEMFQAFGFADRVIREGYQVVETTFWKSDPEQPGQIRRTGRVQDVEEGLSEMPHMILNQARVHDLWLEVMAKSPHRLKPVYATTLTDFAITDDADYPIVAQLQTVDGQGEAFVRRIRTRYLVGCDGAHSTVRRRLGLELVGDSANQAWGVMDLLAVTDFPDIRFKTLIQTADAGNMLIIPREGGYLVRFYVELDALPPGARLERERITVEQLIVAARRILRPYTLEVKDVVWWSVYEIGQRLTARFDDVPPAEAGRRLPRVFICGDACHTHSPKAGQGMNVSMGDAFNLGWKLALVLRGLASPQLLATYSAERQAVAQQLIDFDREWARIMSEPPRLDPETGKPLFQRYFVEHGRFTAGFSVRYMPSMLTGDGSFGALARGFKVGTRFHSAPVIRQADARSLHLGHVVEADGRFRLFVFCPDEDPSDPNSAIFRLCEFLQSDPKSPLCRFTPPGADIDAVIDVRFVLQQRLQDFAPAQLPALFAPCKGRLGLRDYEKLFFADPAPGRDIFDLRGIDRRQGCMVVVRPDQYIAQILPLTAHDALAQYFAGFLCPKQRPAVGAFA
jgi:phenol 2-monooxygenase